MVDDEEDKEENEASAERVGIEQFAEKVGGGRLTEMFWPLYETAPNQELHACMCINQKENPQISANNF